MTPRKEMAAGSDSNPDQDAKTGNQPRDAAPSSARSEKVPRPETGTGSPAERPAASALRRVIIGNSGSGKTTLARKTAAENGIDHLDLDTLAWDPGPIRRPIEQSAAQIEEWLEGRTSWVIEGCYSDLVELVLPTATELVFLNPGVEGCTRNCQARPWEPEKYPSKEAQDANLEMLLAWVRDYETRDDEFSLRRHRQLFEEFGRMKREIGATP